MAATETLAIDLLAEDDVPAALALSQEAGWNQDAADWGLMIREGRAVCMRDGGGHIVASALALPVGERLGWISMVLVTRSWRRKGLATQLMQDCIRWLEDDGRVPVLDATPDGAKVYARLGFEPLAGITRWQHEGPTGRQPEGIVSADVEALDAIAALDGEIFGAARPRVLADLARRGPCLMTAAGDGFVLGRVGRLALQIGPVSAPDEEAALALLDGALVAAGGPVFVDAFDAQAGFAAGLQARGFTVQRPFTRMIRRPMTFGDERRAFAAAGPELG